MHTRVVDLYRRGLVDVTLATLSPRTVLRQLSPAGVVVRDCVGGESPIYVVC